MLLKVVVLWVGVGGRIDDMMFGFGVMVLLLFVLGRRRMVVVFCGRWYLLLMVM